MGMENYRGPEDQYGVPESSRKSSAIIDEAIKALEGIEDMAQIKGTLKETVMSEVLRSEKLQGAAATHELARYLEDDIHNWNFILNNEEADDEAKSEALAYLHEYLESGESPKKEKNEPDENRFSLN